MPVESVRTNNTVNKKNESSFVFNKVELFVGNKKIDELSEEDFIKTTKKTTKKAENKVEK